MCVFVGVTAAAPFSTPSVDRKHSRVLAAFAGNSTTRGHRPSGHLMTTAQAVSTCPTKTPETNTRRSHNKQGTAAQPSPWTTRACFSDLCVSAGWTLWEQWPGSGLGALCCSVRFVFLCVDLPTHTPEPSTLWFAVKSKKKTNWRTAESGSTDQTTCIL